MTQTESKKVLREEYYAVTLSFIYFFCVLASYYVLRPMRDQLSAQAGSQQLPFFFALTFIATLLLTPLFSWAASRFSRRIIVPATYLFFVVCQIAFIPFFINVELIPVKWLALLFFVWVSVFNLFVVSVFWSFMVDIWSDAQAKRLFPIIALGGTLGAIVGPFITKSLVGLIGVANLLFLSAGFLGVAVFCVYLLGNWATKFGINRFQKHSEDALGGGFLDGIKQIFFTPFIRAMSILILLGDAIGTIAYTLITDYSGSTFPNDAIARTEFAANIDLLTNGLQILVQLSLTRWLLINYGARSIFIVWTLIVMTCCLMLSFVPNPYAIAIGSLPWVALFLIISRALAFAMIQPARESLFTLVPRDLRYKGKNAVDTVVWRAGDTISLSLINFVRQFGVGIAGFGAIGALLIVISGSIGWTVSNRLEKKENV